MKKILLLVSAVAALLLAGSCQRESLELVGDGKVTIAVETPGTIGTKTIADGENVDELHYAIYKTNSTEQHAVGVDGSTPLAQGIVPISGKTTTVTFDLLQDQYYTVIFWAQVAGKNHYELGDLRMIEIKDKAVEVNGNDESRAAFFAKYEFNTVQPKDHKVTLRRPFSQLNLLTTVESLSPVQPGQTVGYTVDVKKSEVIVTGLSTAFNTVTGIGVAPADPTAEFKYVMYDTPAKQGQTTLEVNDVDYHYVSMNYLFVPVDGKENPDEAALVGVSYTIDTDNGPVSNSLVNVPVKENYRTNVIGNLLTKETTFLIIVDEKFDEPAFPDKAYDELALAVQLGGSYTLEADMELPSTLTVREGIKLDLDLNGHTLSLNVDGYDDAAAGSFVKPHVIVNNGTLSIKGGTISSLGKNAGSAIRNNGSLTAEDVTFNGAPQEGSKWPSYAVNNYGTMTLTDSKIYSVHGAACSYGEGTVLTMNFTDVDMTGIPGFTGAGLYTENGGKIIVNGGTVENKATDQNSTGGSAINGTVHVNAGTFIGRIENYYGTPVISGGTFTSDPTAYKAENTVVKANANGTYSVLPAVEGADEMVLHEASGLFYNGNTAAHKSVYYLMNASDLKKATEHFVVQSNSNEANKVTFELLADVDLNGTEWNPWNVMFITLNANGHTISNLSNSFFQYAGAVKVNDLTLKNVNASGPEAGTFAARAEGGAFVNCALAGTNTVSYVNEGTDEVGIGAITGVCIESNINVTILENAVVTLKYNDIADTPETLFSSYYHGYKFVGYSENSGNIVLNGELVIGDVSYECSESGTDVVIKALGTNTTTARSVIEGNTTITAAVVGEGITAIGNRTFRKCTGLKSIELPGSLTEIESGAFQTCSSLESIEIPAGVTAIGDQAFYGCSALKSVNIPDGVERIEASSFRALGVTDLVVPASVKFIGQYAFRDNYSMKTLTLLSEDIETIENGALLWAANPDKTAKLTIYVKNDAVKAKVEAVIGSNHATHTVEVK